MHFVLLPNAECRGSQSLFVRSLARLDVNAIATVAAAAAALRSCRHHHYHCMDERATRHGLPPSLTSQLFFGLSLWDTLLAL